MELPGRFLQSMNELLGAEYDSFLQTYDQSAVSSLRVNTSKITVSEFEKTAPFPISKIPFVPNGYYINDTDAWSKHPYYYAGLYYIQEASAMLPAVTLPVEAGDIVLDLCAAPGGKSTQLCLFDADILISNDISRSRTIPLVANLERFGRNNWCVTCESPEKLAAIYPETFDKILVDAPCSGEGMFRKDNKLIASYSEKGPDYYSPIQSEILGQAYKMLNAGGMILYSTCTFSDIEDEQVINDFLMRHPDMSICTIRQEYGLTGPYDKYNGTLLNGCVHALPHRFKGEGHFMALMQKSGNKKEGVTIAADTNTYEEVCKKAGQLTMHFSDELVRKLESRNFLCSRDGYIYMLPDGFGSLFDKNIRYSRTGTCIGTVSQHGKFIPHTAFALYLDPEEYDNKLILDADDPNVIKYLKGETIVADGYGVLPEKGFVLICVGRFPLGFASYDGKRLKNLYEKGWIYK